MFSFLITLMTLLLLDFVWISGLMQRLYQTSFTEDFLAQPFRLPYAAAFYLLFSFSLWYLFVRKFDTVTTQVLIEAALFGLTAYATFALTNMAVIEQWTLKLTILDLVWGGIVAVATVFIAIKISGAFL